MFRTYRDQLAEYITDENLDMLDEFSCLEIANIATHVGMELNNKTTKVYIQPFISLKTSKQYHLKVNNFHKGFVSVSDDESTGVSRTEYYPFYSDDEDGWFAGLMSLASMINEAWYHCNN